MKNTSGIRSMERIIDALVACSQPYFVKSGRRRRVPDVYRAPADPKRLWALAADFPRNTLICSGLYRADPFEPVLTEGALFIVLRDGSDRVIDVLYQEGSFTGR